MEWGSCLGKAAGIVAKSEGQNAECAGGGAVGMFNVPKYASIIVSIVHLCLQFEIIILESNIQSIASICMKNRSLMLFVMSYLGT